LLLEVQNKCTLSWAVRNFVDIEIYIAKIFFLFPQIFYIIL
jgi:hypothetical protein